MSHREFEDMFFKAMRTMIREASLDVGSAGAAERRFTLPLVTDLAPVAAPPGLRHLVYVHGICKHTAGYSTPWWETLRAYGTTAFGAGQLGDTRLEVLWSDIIIPNSTAAAMALAPAVELDVFERQQFLGDLRQELTNRAAASAAHSLGPTRALGASIAPQAAGSLLSIPALQCVDGFAYYMVNDSIRARIIQRFTDCVGPLLQQTGDIDIISHSWGTVVAYEGLRQLADQGLDATRVRNWFTVGAALSIGVVKDRLRPENQDGARPANVRRWVNLNAQGDSVGGQMKGYPYAVDAEYLELPPFGCPGLLNVLVNPSCAHGSYFVAGNEIVNEKIFTWFIDHDTTGGSFPPLITSGDGAAAAPGAGDPNGSGSGDYGAVAAAVAMAAPTPPAAAPLKQAARRSPTEAEIGLAKSKLGKLSALAGFRSTITALTPPERELIIDQAQLMLEQVYAHLPLKRAMYGIDPIQRLRLLKLTHQSLDERDFESAMIEIFVGLRDLHTNYILPSQYSGMSASLPLRIEEFYEGGDPNKRKYVITRVAFNNTNPDLKPGLIVTHWNGSPIENAVERNANREAGSNPEAHRAQGINSLTTRWLGMSLPPDEDWVVLNCLDGDRPVQLRFDWQVFNSAQSAAAAGLSSATAPAAGKFHWGLDLKTAMIQHLRTLLFYPAAVHQQAEMKAWRAQAAVGGAAAAPSPADQPTQSRYPSIFPRVFVTPQYGYIRLATFEPPQLANGDYDVDGAVNEFIRLLELMPRAGLILDVRGNGGGIIAFGERLLQLMSSRQIEPELFYLLITGLNLDIAKKTEWLNDWAPSIAQGVTTGAAFSQGFPLTEPQQCNNVGRRYFGPVVLITDALCYSTTDMFTAGFQDHQIGKILGVNKNTGAGGANVWSHYEVLEQLPLHPDPFLTLPRGVQMRVAARRSTRQGAYAGVPLENLGVVPDEMHYLTLRDVLGSNEDLIAHAANMLAKMTATP
jgi:hypothetical protein